MRAFSDSKVRGSLRVALLSVLMLCVGHSLAKSYIGHELLGDQLRITTDRGIIQFTPITQHAVDVEFFKDNTLRHPSFSLAPIPRDIRFSLEIQENHLEFSGTALTVKIQKAPFHISYWSNKVEVISHQSGFYQTPTHRGVRLHLEASEQLYGGGQRVVGMDRRGFRLPLYNKGHYGYGGHSLQMYYSLPAVMSSKNYAVLFDNAAKGHMDIGAQQNDVLEFEAIGGRNAYQIVVADGLSELTEHITDITGRQPLPPRWALGNFASRFGYRSEQEVRDVVRRFKQQDIPLDTVVIDLYWFGKELKGTMGNLQWEQSQWPEPIKLIAELKEQGIKTILITEPFILNTSKRWQEAKNANALAISTNSEEAFEFDMFFGRGGLVDVFSETGQQWFWQKHKDIYEQGVAGFWGDLGEPEAHPSETLHALGRADEVHNAYGHKWAELIHNGFSEAYPDQRLFMLKRSGFLGSQRFGMMPWTGDVSRSWGGLQAQVELSLQMSVFGLAYTHSDLGGYTGDTYDKELYIRWMQYGVFQPIYRPHSNDKIPPEPVFHDQQTIEILRNYIKLRYRLLPYNYSLSYENTVSGKPLMRPLSFSNNELHFTNADSYLWGDAFWIQPIVEPGLEQVEINLPEGQWFNFWDNTQVSGGSEFSFPLKLNEIPVFVKAGSFVPMVQPFNNIEHYDTSNIDVHYFHHAQNSGQGIFFDDDGKSTKTIEQGRYRLFSFSSAVSDKQLTIHVNSVGNGYSEEPEKRNLNFMIHGLNSDQIENVFINNHPSDLPRMESSQGTRIPVQWDKNNANKIIVIDLIASH